MKWYWYRDYRQKITKTLNESLLFFTLVLANEIIERKKDQQTKYIYVGLIEKHTYSSSEFQLDISLR